MFRIFPLMFAFIIGAQPIGEAFLYSWYRLANTSFTDAFCDNVDKPELECNGKCHLGAITEAPLQANNNDTSLPQSTVPKPRQLESIPPPWCLAALQLACLTTNDNTYPYQPLLDSDWQPTLLRPPIKES